MGGRRTEMWVSSWAAGAKRKGHTVEPQDTAGVERDGHFVGDRREERARRRSGASRRMRVRREGELLSCDVAAVIVDLICARSRDLRVWWPGVGAGFGIVVGEGVGDEAWAGGPLAGIDLPGGPLAGSVCV